MKDDSKEPAMNGHELKKIRESIVKKDGKPISQVSFAKALGVQKSTYAFWEQGRNPISEWAANLIRLTAEKLK